MKSGARTPAAIAAIAAGAFLLPNTALACGVCAMAAVWELYPPLLGWSLILPGWFIALSVLGAVFRWNLSPVPPLSVGILLLIVAVVLAMMYLGPIVALPLGLVAVWGWIRFALARNERAPLLLRRWVHGIGGVAILVMAVSAMAESISPTPREPIDIIRKWPGTSASRIALNRLGSEAAASRETLRSIVRGTPGEFDPLEAWQAAAKLQVVEEPELDVPLLLDAYARLYDPQSETGWPSSYMEWALKVHTGLDLPRHSAPDVWQAAWAERLSVRGEQAARRPDVDEAGENLL